MKTTRQKKAERERILKPVSIEWIEDDLMIDTDHGRLKLDARARGWLAGVFGTRPEAGQ